MRKTFNDKKADVLGDYRLGVRSRQVSIVGRREVLTGKAKFGIFGAGKELAQLAMAKVFEKGDFRSGYYRDQTFMFAVGELTPAEFFSQLYAHADLAHDPVTGGRSMNAHFGTRSLNKDGSWKNLMETHNSSADVSPTASQMPRLVGLAYASKLYRELDVSKDLEKFSNNGSEVAFGTIGNASCAEGMFWEALNAIGVLQVPAVISIWDDDYGISVPNKYQVTRDLSKLLSGFQREKDSRDGFDVYRVRAWDYPGLIEIYQKATKEAREYHVPAIIHVVEVTQPQGHSTSGSHERYKPAERLEWEKKFDCLEKFREWMIENDLVTVDELSQIDGEEAKRVEKNRKDAFEAFRKPFLKELDEFLSILDGLVDVSQNAGELGIIKGQLKSKPAIMRNDMMTAAQKVLLVMRDEDIAAKNKLARWRNEFDQDIQGKYSSHLYLDGKNSALVVKEIKAEFSENSPLLNGFEVMNRAFDAILARDARVIAFGEDLGYLGDVNQGFVGLQEKYGVNRVTDTGIREITIVGQAIGAAMRGLRPIAEIQYLDYLLYALQLMSDDLATLSWRTVGGQKAPVIIRTRGHRLEGIWHSGSLMAGIINLVRGMRVLVPRNMVQAVGFYNALLKAEEPGLIVEVLNGYRLKERLPDNYDKFTVPLGVPEIMRKGDDITVVTYGPLVGIAHEAADRLMEVGIEMELVDVQSLLPFDINGRILESLKKTNRILFLDEDVPGGTTAYMMQEVIEKQGGYSWLDSKPRTLSAKEHRPAYGSDGNYWSKPNVETIFEQVYEMMNEAAPVRYPMFY